MTQEKIADYYIIAQVKFDEAVRRRTEVGDLVALKAKQVQDLASELGGMVGENIRRRILKTAGGFLEVRYLGINIPAEIVLFDAGCNAI